jgi:hypothetical protein
MWLKNNKKTKNTNTKCARQMWKWIFIMLTYVNMNMKRTWQGYGVRLCLKLVLNRLKEMRDPTYLYPFRDLAQEASKEASMCASSKNSWKPS